MIDLTFGDSSAGALKLAKSGRSGGSQCRAYAVIGGALALPARVENPVCAPMDGSPADVAPLTLALDIGDLSDALGDSHSRRQTLERLYGRYDGVAGELWNSARKTLDRLKRAAKTREPVRMWACACDPAELCGVMYVCRLLCGAELPLSVVFVPNRIECADSVTVLRSTGELAPEQFAALARHERLLSPAARSAYAAEWDALAAENAPLRAVINGRVTGVREDFYDFALRDCMPEGEFVAAQLIGKALGRLPGVSDCWLFLRLQAMLESGELIELAPPRDEHPYSAVWTRGR